MIITRKTAQRAVEVRSMEPGQWFMMDGSLYCRCFGSGRDPLLCVFHADSATLMHAEADDTGIPVEVVEIVIR